MKCFAIVFCVGLITGLAYGESAKGDLKAQASEQQTAASSLYPLQDKKQEKRYVGGGYGSYAGYGGYGGYGGLDYSSRVLGLDAGSVYNPGYNAYNGYGGYGGAGYAGAGYGGYNAYPYHGSGLSYNNYNRFGYSGYNSYPSSLGYGGYNSYPSSYYSSGYGNSIVGGGLGGLGTAGFVPPVGGGLGAGHQYGPGISGSIY